MLYPLRLGAQDRRVDPCPAALCAAASWHREDQPARSAFPPPRRAIESLDVNKEASNTCFVRTRHRSCGSPARERQLAPGPVQIAAFSPRRRKPAELSDPHLSQHPSSGEVASQPPVDHQHYQEIGLLHAFLLLGIHSTLALDPEIDAERRAEVRRGIERRRRVAEPDSLEAGDAGKGAWHGGNRLVRWFLSGSVSGCPRQVPTRAGECKRFPPQEAIAGPPPRRKHPPTRGTSDQQLVDCAHSRSGPSRVSPVARRYPASRPPAMLSDIRTAGWRGESFARCA